MHRVVLTTGGTGGHIFPALAVARELKSRHPGVDILFIGGSSGPEGRMAAEAGLRFVGLPARGVFGRGVRAVAAVGLLLRSLHLAWRELGRFRPEVVLGFGGYASFASMAAAALRGIPTAVHEQNSIPGVANRLSGRFARRVFLSFPDVRVDFSAEKIRMTGNPVREEIRRIREHRQKGGPVRDGGRVLVLGGSQGATAVNSRILEALLPLLKAGVQIRHQTGSRDFERVRQGYADRWADPSAVSAFIEDMAEAYAWADLAVSRSGASTVAELAVAGKPSLLIPFPYATHDHQARNARFLEQAGAAVTIREGALNGETLAKNILSLLGDADRLASMGAAAAGLGRPEAAANVVNELEALVVGA